LIGARRHDVESSVFSGTADIEVTRHRELLTFTVFGHFREEAGELDVIACDGIGGEYFVTFDVGEVFARGLVFESEILRGDIAYLVSVGGGIYFDGVIFELERFIYYVDWYAREPLVQYLIMNSARIDGDTRFRFGVRCGAEYQSRDVGEDHATKGVRQAHIDFVDGESELASFIGF
jgi:hypothetical protein